MKKLIVAAILMTGMASVAQEQTLAKKDKMEQLTPAQRNELHLKKMTLELGLNATQQKEMGGLIAEQSTKREAAKAERKKKIESGKKPTADEKFAMQNKRLDEQIAMKERVKKILTPDQFAKWEKMKEKKRLHKNGEGKKRRMKPEPKK